MKNKLISLSIVLVLICGVIGIFSNNRTLIKEEEHEVKKETDKQINKVKSDEKDNTKDVNSLSNVSNDEETVKLSNDSSRKNQTNTSADDSNNDNEIKKSISSSNSNKDTSNTSNNSNINKKEAKPSNNLNSNKGIASSNSTNNKETYKSSSDSSNSNSSKNPDDAYTGGTDWDKVGEELENAEWNHVGSGEIDPGGNTYDQWEAK